MCIGFGSVRERYCDLVGCVRVQVGEEGNHIGRSEKVKGVWTDEIGQHIEDNESHISCCQRRELQI